MTKRHLRLAHLQNAIRPITVLMATILVGVGLVLLTHADTSTKSIEADAGIAVLPANKQPVGGASGGYAVKFGTNPSNTKKRFYIVGKDIVDPDGNIFLPMGANVGMRQAPNLEYNFLFNYFGTANGKSDQVKAWGWNIVRPNIACTQVPGGPTTQQTLDGLQDLIQEYAAKKIVVMVTCRVDVWYDHPYNEAQIQASLPMIKTIAELYKDEPYLWMNPFNEPVINQSVWTGLNQSLYNDVRAVAPDMMFVADLAGSGNQIENLVDGNLATTFGSGKCNVLYDWHAYGFINGSFANDATHQSYINRLAGKNIAMVIGEFGDPLLQDGSPFMVRVDPDHDGIAGNPVQNRIAANAVIKYAPPAGYGLIWWIATGDRNDQITYSLTRDMTSPWTVTSANASTKLAPAGKAFWDTTHPARTVTRFTGNLAASGCASAQ